MWKDHDKYINKDGSLRRYPPTSREELERLTKDYLDSGGKIKKCPPGRFSRGVRLKPRYYLDKLNESAEYQAYLGSSLEPLDGNFLYGWDTNFCWGADDDEGVHDPYFESDVLEDDYSEESFP